MRRRHHQNRILLLAVGAFFILLLFFTLLFRIFSDDYQAIHAVEDFYEHEQKGDFTDSWELLHSFMKDRWTKGSFIQDRAHVFINHFGADTFQFTIEEVEEIEEWRMAKDLPPVVKAHKFIVIQTYKGKYGKFNFMQEVYVAEEHGEWRILWDYN
ncbi:hypothetical protein [Jeotgalibacillus campisalis]|uniref:DUF4878 domain-containing protein n=1 Tax=Jeotgalibacillus campisalis TaxID=220754 RepID=A0A0C2RMR2_9BACL|nr:hypothetical protein [Jeotgalibacillus campisalis]KIL43039.1 hypothetical protein KR50_34420 [Jeotgalibacillus campisalis]